MGAYDPLGRILILNSKLLKEESMSYGFKRPTTKISDPNSKYYGLIKRSKVFIVLYGKSLILF
jgi:hypothetical protein